VFYNVIAAHYDPEFYCRRLTPFVNFVSSWRWVGSAWCSSFLSCKGLLVCCG